MTLRTSWAIIAVALLSVLPVLAVNPPWVKPDHIPPDEVSEDDKWIEIDGASTTCVARPESYMCFTAEDPPGSCVWATYEWDTDGGFIVDGGIWDDWISVSWDTPGEKTVTVTHNSNAEDEYGNSITQFNGQVASMQVTVLKVESVEWLDSAGNPITEANDHPDPAAAVGLKYYPGAATPSADWDDEVRIRVTIAPAISGIDVYLKDFDPDDPSANSDEVDNDTNGGDNRGAGFLGSTYGTTDASGQVTVDYHLSHQPGDNHRVAATVLDPGDLSSLNDNNVPANNDQVSGFCGRISDLMTVWRKLHVENDSMQAVPDPRGDPDQASFHGLVWYIDPPGDGQSTLRVESSDMSILDEFFEDGFIKSGSLQFKVTSSSYISLLNVYDLVISSEPNASEQSAFLDFDNEVHDDDGTGLPASMTPQLPKLDLVTDAVKAKFPPAYISLEEVPATLNPNKYVPFKLYEKTGGILGTSLDNEKDVTDSEKYWAQLVTSAFQPEGDSIFTGNDDDGDPHSGSDMDDGVTMGQTTSGRAAGIFVESIREVNRLLATPYMATPMQEDFDGVTAHEIGHCPGGASEASDHAEGGLLDVDNVGDPDAVFEPPTLKRFREAEKWQE